MPEQTTLVAAAAPHKRTTTEQATAPMYKRIETLLRWREAPAKRLAELDTEIDDWRRKINLLEGNQSAAPEEKQQNG